MINRIVENYKYKEMKNMLRRVNQKREGHQWEMSVQEQVRKIVNKWGRNGRTMERIFWRLIEL